MATGSGIAIRLGRWLSHRGQYLVETWWMERSFCSWDIMQEDEDSKKNGRDEKEGWLEGGTAVVDQVIWISICYFNRWLVDGLGWWFGIPVVPIIMYHVYIYIGGGATIYIYNICSIYKYVPETGKGGAWIPACRSWELTKTTRCFIVGISSKKPFVDPFGSSSTPPKVWSSMGPSLMVDLMSECASQSDSAGSVEEWAFVKVNHYKFKVTGDLGTTKPLKYYTRKLHKNHQSGVDYRN